MKNKILMIVLSVFLISFASAINLVGEESYSFDLGQEYSYYIISENSTALNLDISQNGTIVTIIPDKYQQEDSFIITFYGVKDEVIGSSNSGSSSSSYGTWRGTQKNTIEKGITKTFYKNTFLKFNTASGNSHKINLQTILNDSVIFEINSETIYVTLSLGEEKKISVENDSYYDLLLRLEKMSNNKAELFIKQINEKIILENEENEEVEEIPQEINEEENEKYSFKNIGIIILVLMLIVLFYILKKEILKNGKHNNIHH